MITEETHTMTGGFPDKPPVEPPQPKPGSDGEKPDECSN
jgi:hypothetical protein